MADDTSTPVQVVHPTADQGADQQGQVAQAPPIDPFWLTHKPNRFTTSGRMFIDAPERIVPLTPDQQAALQAQLPSGPAPVQAPQGGGAGMPDLAPGLMQALQRLPVGQAMQAFDTATRYQAQRGYQQDIQGGMSAQSAWAKWAPLLFGRNASGMATAMRLSNPQQSPPMTQNQIARNQIAQQQLAMSKQRAARAQAVAATALSPLQKADLQLKSATLGRAQIALSAATRSGDPKAIAEARQDVQDARADYDKFRAGLNPVPAPVPAAGSRTSVVAPAQAARVPAAPPVAQPNAVQAPVPGLFSTLRTALKGGAPKVTTQAQYDALPVGAVYVDGNGKKWRKKAPAQAPQASETAQK